MSAKSDGPAGFRKLDEELKAITFWQKLLLDLIDKKSDSCTMKMKFGGTWVEVEIRILTVDGKPMRPVVH